MHRWFWKCGRLFFFAGKLLYGPFQGIFWGGQDFFDPLNCAERSPLKIARKMAHKVICPKTKNNLPNFQNQRCIGIFISLCDQLPSILSLYSFFLHFFIVLIMICRENPAKSQFGKKSAKVYHSLYSSTEQLQLSWWTCMFFKLGFNNEKSIHTLPLQSLPLLSLIL